MLNKFILKSAPLDLRLPVSSLFVVCLIVPYRNPATPNETLVLMLFMICLLYTSDAADEL